MANTPGGLRSFSVKVLSDHLPLLASREAVLTLQVSDGFSERVLYWWNGRLFILSSGERSGPGLASYLVRAGKLEAKDSEAMLQECKRSKTSLEESLLSRQVLTHAEHETTMPRLVYDELFDLVFWEDALFLSYEAPPPPDFFGAEPNLLSAEIPPGQLVEDLSAWIRKWVASKPLLKSDRVRLRLEEGGGEATRDQPDPSSAILDACRKGATFRELRHKVDMEVPELCDHLTQWIEAGVISAGDEALPALTPQQAIEKLEKILPAAVGKDLVRLKLANLHKKAKRPDKACSYFQLVADQATARADWALACDCLRSLLTIRPEDLVVLRQLMKIHIDQGQTKQAILRAMHLEQALLKERKVEEMKAVAEILAGIPGAQLAAQEVRTDLKLVLGDVERAAEEYQAIADRHEEGGDLDRALQLLGKAVELDGENGSLKRRLLRLKQRMQGPAPTAKRSRSPRGALRSGRDWLSDHIPRAVRLPLPILACLLLVGGLLYYALRLPTGESLDVEAFVVDKRRPEPPPTRQRDDRPRIVVTIPVLERSPPVKQGSAPEPADEIDRPREEAPPPAPALLPPEPAPRGAEADPVVPAEAGPGAPPSGEEVAADPAPENTPPPASTPAEATKEPPPASPGSGAEGTSSAPPASPGTPLVTEKRVPPEVVFQDALPRRPCPRHGLHTQVSRRLEGEKVIRYADGCTLRIEDARTGEILLDLEAPAGARWAYDPRGELVLAWKPGEPATVFTRVPRSSRTMTDWTVPAETAALAAGGMTAALRLGETTRIVRLSDGGEVRSGKLPPWNDGFFDGNRLLLSRDVTAGSGGVRPWMVVDTETLAVIPEAEVERTGEAPGRRREEGLDAPPSPPGPEGEREKDGKTPDEGSED